MASCFLSTTQYKGIAEPSGVLRDLLCMDGRRQGLACRPSARQSAIDLIPRQASSDSPLWDRQRLALPRQDASRSSTSTTSDLFVWRGPSTVLRRIRAIVVDTINRVTCRRFRSHIREEVSEGRTPPFTDDNTSAAISVKSLVAWVFATLDHVHPRVVFRCVRSSVFVIHNQIIADMARARG